MQLPVHWPWPASVAAAVLALSVACQGTSVSAQSATPSAPPENTPTAVAAQQTRPAAVEVQPTAPTARSEVAPVVAQDNPLQIQVDGQPVTAESLPTKEAYYQELLARYGQDFRPCFAQPTPQAGTCPKPASLGATELKQQVNVELILDASGSMAEKVDGEPKLDIAKRVLSQFIDTLPQTANVSLRVYGHKGSSADADKTLSCASSELIYPFQKLDKSSFQQVINTFQPSGWTPLGSSLQAAADDFNTFDAANSSNFVYVVSDGIETCDTDPVAAARNLHSSNVQPIVNIVGFDVDTESVQQLQQAAQAGGGQFYEAHNSAELDQLFKDTFDWNEWTAYYNCRWLAATQQYNQVWQAQTDSYNCTWTRSTREYNDIWGEATRRYNAIWAAATDAYNSFYAANQNNSQALSNAERQQSDLIRAAEQLSDYAIAQASARNDKLVAASQQQTSSVIAQADAEYRQAIQQNEQDYRQRTTP